MYVHDKREHWKMTLFEERMLAASSADPVKAGVDEKKELVRCVPPHSTWKTVKVCDFFSAALYLLQWIRMGCVTLSFSRLICRMRLVIPLHSHPLYVRKQKPEMRC